MRICVDTTILIDILKDECKDFQDKLYLALSKREALVIPVIVYAELMPQFKGNTDTQNEFLKEHKISIETLDFDACTTAARAWMKYLKRKNRLKCPECGKELGIKAHFLSDFYIGGFALKKCDFILTRDRGIYKKYFPQLAGYEGCLESPS